MKQTNGNNSTARIIPAYAIYCYCKHIVVFNYLRLDEYLTCPLCNHIFSKKEIQLLLDKENIYYG